MSLKSDILNIRQAQKNEVEKELAQPRLIRYLENGVYKYASVKSVGDLDKLKTTSKDDLVSAINELIVTGGAIPQEVDDRLTAVEGSTTSQGEKITEHESIISQQGTKIEKHETDISQVKTDYKLSAEQIALNTAKNEEIKKKTIELAEKSDQIVLDLAEKAGLEYVDGKLVLKVDTETYEEQYERLKRELLEKVDIDKYLLDYNNLVDGIKDKVDSIDYQSKVDKLNESIANQKNEIDFAKKDLEETQTAIDLTKEELDGTVADLLKTKEELDSVKDNIVYKVEIFSTNGGVFKNGEFDTVLEAKVYHGMNDVTASFNASKFRWTRISRDGDGDIAWNTRNAGGTKSIRITPSDVYVRATFNCEVLE